MKVRAKMLDGQEYIPGEKLPEIECFRCGVCCQGYYPQLDQEELERMAADMRLTPNEFISKYVQTTKIGYLLRQEHDGCVFLGWEEDSPPSTSLRPGRALCRIHSIRPEACRRCVPSLSRRECREGLARMQREGEPLILASDLYHSPEELERFCGGLKQKPDVI